MISAAVMGRRYGLMEVREMGEVNVAGDRYMKDHSRDGESLAPRKGRMGIQGAEIVLGWGQIGLKRVR